MWQFKKFNFKVAAIICDGARTNLSALKTLCRRSGAYGSDPTQQDPYKVSVSFHNPFSVQDSFMIICPSHQVLQYLCLLIVLAYHFIVH